MGRSDSAAGAHSRRMRIGRQGERVSEKSFSGHPPFAVRAPDRQSVPFVFNSPHSGRIYPAEFLAESRLDRLTITHFGRFLCRRALRRGPRASARRCCRRISRAPISTSTASPIELDPRDVLDGPAPHLSIRVRCALPAASARSRALVAENMEIYRGKLPVAEALDRIETFYKPYHAALRQPARRDPCRRFGDCGARRLPFHARERARVAVQRSRPDFVLGDRFGTSCVGRSVSRPAIDLF